jgi:dolichyl-phosphate beta-glucosyltransferase
MIKKIFKYCVVGVAGTLIDLGVLYVFVEYFTVPLIPAAILAFILAATNNFIFNKIWTFKNKSKNYRKLYIKFLTVSVIGLGLTVVAMYTMVNILDVWYMFAKVLTSLIVLTWNFLANKYWTFHLSQSPNTFSKDLHYKLSIIIPAYNEENRITHTLPIIKNFLEKKKMNAEIIVVNDGSSDSTKEVVEELKRTIPNLKLINLDRNHGKGFAVKKGIEANKGEYILFVDADNSTPIEEFEKLMNKMRESKSNIAIGSRYLHDSNVRIKQPLYRIFLGRIGNTLTRLFLIDGIKDTQCGFKLFEHKVAQEIFSFQKIKRFAFDIEVLVVAKNLDYKIIEVPVSWFNSPESRIRPVKDALRTFKDLIHIKLNLWGGRYSSD